MTARPDRWFPLTLRVAALLLFLWMVRSLLVAAGLGLLLAILLDPLQRRIVRWGPRFAIAAPGLLTMGTLVVVVIPLGLIAVRVMASVQKFNEGDLGLAVSQVQAFAARHLSGIAKGLSLPMERIRNGAVEAAQNLAGFIGELAGQMAAALPGQVADLFLFVLALYFFLRDGAKARLWMTQALPFSAGQTHDLFESIQHTVQGALLGQLAVSALQGGLTLVALYVFQIPGALMLAVIATLLSVLPVIGTMPVTVGATFYLIATGRTGAAIGMAISAAVIGISDNLVRPWVQSAKDEMHPLLTLLAIFGGIQALGWGGVFLGPVVAAVALWAVALKEQTPGGSPQGPVVSP